VTVTGAVRASARGEGSPVPVDRQLGVLPSPRWMTGPGSRELYGAVAVTDLVGLRSVSRDRKLPLSGCNRAKRSCTVLGLATARAPFEAGGHSGNVECEAVFGGLSSWRVARL